MEGWSAARAMRYAEVDSKPIPAATVRAPSSMESAILPVNGMENSIRRRVVPLTTRLPRLSFRRINRQSEAVLHGFHAQ